MNKTFGLSTVATNGSLASVGPLRSPQTFLNFSRIWRGASVTAPNPQPPYNTTLEGKENATALSTKDVAASQCFLYWCVNTIQVVVINGQLSETRTDSWYNKTTFRSDNFGSCFFTYMSENETWNLKAPSLHSDDSPSDFVIARCASEALSNWLASHLTISTGRDLGDTKVDDYYATDPSHREFEKQRLLLETNMTAMFENLAASMNQNLRIASIDSQRVSPASLNILGVGPASGTATSWEILISVRWPWLAFPVTLLLVALDFFVLTLLSTCRHQLPVWKISPFPLIFNRVDDSHLAPQSKVSQSVKMPVLERRAAKLSASLEECDGGPGLSTLKGHVRYRPVQEDSSS